MEDKVILCASSAYEKKYYLNPDFETLPDSVKQELKIMCVLYTEDVGGILMVVFDDEGSLKLEVSQQDNDFAFDEIGSRLKIKEMQKTKGELFQALELFYKVFFLGEEL